MDTELRLQSIERDRAIEAGQAQLKARARVLSPAESHVARPAHWRLIRAFARTRFFGSTRADDALTGQRAGATDVRRSY